ncbi:unnamed protein product, partial [Ilex paraguariensis]
MGTHEPYWQTNSSFSPPPRWDFRFQNEGLSFGSHEGIQLYGSSTSSNSRESRSWMRGNHSSGHQYVTSDAVGPYFSSPSDISPAPQWTQPTIHDISVDDYGTSRRADCLMNYKFCLSCERSQWNAVVLQSCCSGIPA